MEGVVLVLLIFNKEASDSVSTLSILHSIVTLSKFERYQILLSQFSCSTLSILIFYSFNYLSSYSFDKKKKIKVLDSTLSILMFYAFNSPSSYNFDKEIKNKWIKQRQPRSAKRFGKGETIWNAFMKWSTKLRELASHFEVCDPVPEGVPFKIR